MKHLKTYKIYEHYASNRMERRRYEKWNNLSNKEKRNKYDAEIQFKKITKKWDKGTSPYLNDKSVWSIREYLKGYTKAETKAVHLSADSDLLNRWTTMEDSWKYEKGVEKEFSKWLKKNNYRVNWDSERDGIFIIPDHEGLYWYYEQLAGVEPELVRKKRKIPEKNYKEIKEIINLFKKEGYNITEPPDSEYNDSEGTDRYEFNYEFEGMTIRFYILKSNTIMNNTSYKQAVKNEIEDMKEHFSDYLPEIKYVYEFCKSIAEGDLWTMPGGGGQLQQFYGDDGGYLCIMYMGMRGEKSSRTCSVVPQRRKKDFLKNFDEAPLKKFAKFRKETNKFNL